MSAGIGSIIGLAFALATGLLLLILACALENNWWPFFSLIAYVAAPIPNLIASRGCCCCNGDDLMLDSGSSGGKADFGHFATSFFVVSGIALPIVLAHAFIISNQAMGLSIAGGVCIYAATVTYIQMFSSDDSF
ncbi:hypothetical protein MIR68_011232 [Amoeboaphelidium protococcarum]|nr:hypothetical protein MIR68_012450 [Amoeboaphelidium protococcarum]KAI3629797.1 hypothetical protein MIR68_011232 [Amoeboaphelidium protococcarum]KAI3644035.1 hypothetical protein MP228_010199 [Amoeboaphelidium protococcarum]